MSESGICRLCKEYNRLARHLSRAVSRQVLSAIASRQASCNQQVPVPAGDRGVVPEQQLLSVGTPLVYMAEMFGAIMPADMANMAIAKVGRNWQIR
ncbi:hypothetical protein BD309DRAFT_745998 [Dichomitus squalens]|nr:hypothetical protein BD309DRAFT_745998 [Dichomitus squalens]